MSLLTGITVGIAVWVLVAIVLGLFIARAIRLRDQQAPAEDRVDTAPREDHNRTGY